MGSDTPAPNYAQSAGYTLNTFHSGPFGADNVDLDDSGRPGFHWYLSKPFGDPPADPSTVTFNDDGSATITDRLNAFDGQRGHGIGFGGGAYFEAALSFDRTRCPRTTGRRSPGRVGGPCRSSIFLGYPKSTG